MADIEITNPPSDGISSIKFFQSESSTNILVTSWDASVRIYNPFLNRLLSVIKTKAALLDSCISSNSQECFAAGLSSEILRIDWTSETLLSAVGLLISGGWDKRVKFWDIRSDSLVYDIEQPGKVYAMDLSSSPERLLVAMAGRHIDVYDLRRLPNCVQRRESSLKHQTRNIKWFSDGQGNLRLLALGFVCSSVEGRVSVDYIDKDPDVQAKKYAFKCHRSTVDGVETVFPVNALAFHPKCMTFATGGSDGIVCLWDLLGKKKLKSFSKYQTSISAMDFDSSGEYLAIASSYCYEEGEKDHPLDSIHLKKVAEDVKSRASFQ